MNLTVNQPSVSTQRYDCHGCTNCCRDLVVQLTSDDRTRIDGGGWARRLKVEPYVRLGRMTVLNHRPTGGCVFLTDQGQCLIHAEQGASAKPLACRLYPFTFQPEADALRVGYRFDCPSVARNDGSPLPKHRRLLERLAQSKFPHGFHPRAADRWELIKDYPLAGTTVDRLIDRMDRWLADRGQPFQLRLLGLYSLTQTLGAARLKRFDDARLIELVTLLSSDLAGTAHELSERSIEPPTRRQSRLFSQAIFAHCEHVTFQQARSPFLKALAIRWDQLKRSRRLASRIGEIPRLGPLPDGGGFESLERMKPDRGLAEREGDDLLTRFLRARITGRTTFGVAYYGWPLLDGLRALLLSTAVLGWLTRHVAQSHARSGYRYEDLVTAVGLVDRTAGRAPELGARSARLRLRYLSEENGLLRLLRAYPIIVGV